MPEFITTSQINEEQQDNLIAGEMELPECKHCHSVGDVGCTKNPRTCSAQKIVDHYPIQKISEYIDWHDLITENNWVEKINWEGVVEDYASDNFGCIGDGAILEANRIELIDIVDSEELKKELNSEIEKILLNRIYEIDTEIGQAIKNVFEKHGHDIDYETYYFRTVVHRGE